MIKKDSFYAFFDELWRVFWGHFQSFLGSFLVIFRLIFSSFLGLF